MSAPGAVGRTARLLGFAGLLPQAAAVLLIVSGRREAGLFALLYAAVILSFLGGVWWGLAMRRTGRQAGLATIAVLPSLVAVALVLAAFGSLFLPLGPDADRWARMALIALGSAIMLTLLVDRHLITTGEAPAGWMGLRAPLSLGLGLLTIAAGLLARL